MSKMPDAQIATVNGLKLAYYEWGDDQLPSLICLHSHTNSAASWREFAEFASKKYHVIAIDQRGHGNSEWARDGYARDKFVSDLTEFIDQKQIDKVTLVGCSMGGWHSILYAASGQTTVVDRIVMVDIAPEPSAERLQQPIAPLPPQEFQSLAEGFDWLRTGNALATDERLLEEAESRLKRTTNNDWTWKADIIGFDNPLPDMTDSSLISRYWAAFGSLECPILEVRGVESGLVSDEIIERMHNIGWDFSSVDVGLASHVVMVDQPEKFIASVKDFLFL